MLLYCFCEAVDLFTFMCIKTSYTTLTPTLTEASLKVEWTSALTTLDARCTEKDGEIAFLKEIEASLKVEWTSALTTLDARCTEVGLLVFVAWYAHVDSRRSRSPLHIVSPRLASSRIRWKSLKRNATTWTRIIAN